jgi:hypothetical protein
MKFYEKLASTLDAMRNCKKNNNQEWYEKHKATAEELVKQLPHGSGIDGKTIIDPDRCRKDLIIIESSYHCMNDVGMYDDWIDFELWIRPNFSGIDIDVKGRFSDRHGKYATTKDYLSDTFSVALQEDVDQQPN